MTILLFAVKFSAEKLHSDEDKYADKFDMPGQKIDTKQRVTQRNLRIREDTAKYLRNLDLESAYYDPKSRALKANPLPNADPTTLDYAGDAFYQKSGDAATIARMQLFAWDASERGADINLQSEPSRAELLFKELQFQHSEVKETINKDLLERYGGAEHLVKPNFDLTAPDVSVIANEQKTKPENGEEDPE